MKSAALLVKECQETFGAKFFLIGDRLIVRAPVPLPETLMTDLKELRPSVIAVVRAERQDRLDCWMLEEWRRGSIPSWRRILQEAIDSKDKNREEYARWMLREVLQDEEYKEP